jgi:hypothetical protein
MSDHSRIFIYISVYRGSLMNSFSVLDMKLLIPGKVPQIAHLPSLLRAKRVIWRYGEGTYETPIFNMYPHASRTVSRLVSPRVVLRDAENL